MLWRYSPKGLSSVRGGEREFGASGGAKRRGFDPFDGSQYDGGVRACVKNEGGADPRLWR